MTQIQELIERLEKATGPDRELDMLIGKAVGHIAEDAEWKQREWPEGFTPPADLPPSYSGEWERPCYRDEVADYRKRLQEFLETDEYHTDPGAWDRNNAAPYEKYAGGLFPSGRVALYTRSIDAVMTLVPEGYSAVIEALSEDALKLRGHRGVATLYAGSELSRTKHLTDEATGATPAIALCIAALKARSQAAPIPAHERTGK